MYFFNLFTEESQTPEVCSSPLIGNRNKVTDASTSPVRSPDKKSSPEPWPSQCDEDIDRLVALHQNRTSLSSLGVSN